jgi:matrix metalloproteinase-14 (membrane-inserted)
MKTTIPPFLSGDKYWKFNNTRPLPGYPRNMSLGFPGAPSNVDAAFVWGGNGKIYFVKDDVFWKFDPDANPNVR